MSVGMRRIRSILLLCFALFSLWGCSGSGLQPVTETEEKQYQRGLRLLREGRKDEALLSFQKVVGKRDDAPESHLEIGRIHANHSNDPVAAIYHYRMYLQVDPHSAQSLRVEQLINTAKKQFASQLPGQPFKSDLDRLDLLDLLEESRDENILLIEQLADAQGQLERMEQIQVAKSAVVQQMQYAKPTQQMSAGPGVSDSGRQSAHSSSSSSYTVSAGDTLTRISIKVYGKTNGWMDIYEANRDIMSSPHSLRAGQTLRIPALRL